MPPQTPAFHVLIIGAGISGLVLAQGLKYRNIPFTVFERDSSLSHRSQGYRFNVEDTGADALQSTISPELWDLFERTSPKMMNPHNPHFDARTGENFFTHAGPPGRRYAVDRTWVRELLCIGIENRVMFGKAYASHEVLVDDTGISTVHVTFQDGSSSQGTLLVAADGIHSKLRQQLLPSHKLIDIQRLAIYGKTPITPAFPSSFHAPSIGLYACIDDRSHPSRVMVYSPVDWTDKDLPSLSSGKLSNKSSYYYWAMTTEIPPPQEPPPITGPNVPLGAQKAYTLSISRDWLPSLRTILEYQTPETTYAIRILSSKPDIPPWETFPGVTFMGDAIHPMSPAAASGGITAIQDAASLCGILGKYAGGVWGRERQEDPMKGIAEYENQMRQRAKRAIERSFLAGKMLWSGRDWWEYDEC